MQLPFAHGASSRASEEKPGGGVSNGPSTRASESTLPEGYFLLFHSFTTWILVSPTCVPGTLQSVGNEQVSCIRLGKLRASQSKHAREIAMQGK